MPPPNASLVDFYFFPATERHVLSALVIPFDEQYQLARGTYIPLLLTSSAGELEHLDLRQWTCAGQHICGSYFVGMETGADPTSLGPILRDVDARWMYVSSRWGWGSIHVFGNQSRALHTLRSIPGVKYVEIAGFSTIGGSGEINWLASTLPFDAGTPKRRDGVVQGRTGDTLRLTYIQPSGDTLTAERVLLLNGGGVVEDTLCC